MFESIENLNPDPVVQTDEIWKLAISQGEAHHDQMVIATVNEARQPSARIVLLKEIRDFGLVFYSNYESQKGSEIEANPQISALLYWPNLDIQIRWQGHVEKLMTEESDAYFATRQRESQIGAWASQQSRVLKSRESLEDRFKHFEEKFADQPVPRPDYWGGYQLIPQSVHLLERRDHRLHDSYLYSLDKEGQWQIKRLNP